MEDLPITDDALLTAMQRDWEDNLRFFCSREGQKLRERWVVLTFLQAIGIAVEERELIECPQDDPVDVEIRGALFQVKEIKEIATRVAKAKSLEQTLGAGPLYDVPLPVDGGRLLLSEVGELMNKYATVRKNLDLLFYVTRTRVSMPSACKLDPDSFSALNWRSISCLIGNRGVVLAASETAPEFLRNRVRRE